MRLYERLRLAGIGIALAAVMAAVLGWYAVHWTPDRARYPLQGIDASADNGAIDWLMVRARGADFAYVRATVGAGQRDARFAENWAALGDAQLPHGAVHVFSLCDDARAQAANFVRTVPRDADALPAAVAFDFAQGCDARPDRADVLARVQLFLRLAEHHSGKPMLLRVSRSFEKRYGLTRALDRPAWVVRPFFAPDYTAQHWRMWRASSFRRIDGVSGLVHWDVIADDR